MIEVICHHLLYCVTLVGLLYLLPTNHVVSRKYYENQGIVQNRVAALFAFRSIDISSAGFCWKLSQKYGKILGRILPVTGHYKLEKDRNLNLNT